MLLSQAGDGALAEMASFGGVQLRDEPASWRDREDKQLKDPIRP